MSFRESTAGRNKVKTSVENKPRRCKKKVHELQVWRGAQKGALDSADKHVRFRKKFKVCMLICFLREYVADFYLAETVVSYFDTVFLSSGGYLLPSSI